MLDLIKEIDYFGYTPQFLISGEKKYKSVLGGLVFTLFGLFASYYFGTEFYAFILNRTNVYTSRDLLKYSGQFNLSTLDFYFGVGFIDSTNKEYDLNSFPYFNIYMIIANIDKNGTRVDKKILLTACEYDLFIDRDTFISYSDEELEDLKNRSKYYLCPPREFKMKFNPYLYGDNEIFLQVNFDFTNSSILNKVKDQMNQIRPRLNYIFKNVFIDSENKTKPFNTYVDSFWTEVDYQIAKKVELSLNPFEMLDNNNFLESSILKSVDTNVSDFANKTIFQTSIKSTQLGIYNNRIDKLAFNLNFPFLNFFKIKICLNPIMRQTLRNYKKFDTFLAEVTSILSNILMVFALIMIRYNSVQGKNNMIMSMFTNKSLDNLKLFRDDFKTIFEDKCINNKQNKSKLKNSLLENETNRSIRSHFCFNSKIDVLILGKMMMNENNKLNSSPQNEIRLVDLPENISHMYFLNYLRGDKEINSIKYDIINMKKACHSAPTKIKKEPSYSNLTPCKQIFSSKDTNISPNTQLQSSENLSFHEDILDLIMKEMIEFSFIDYIKSFFRPKLKRNIIYLNAIENLDFIMDIEKYLKFHLDMKLVKEVLFDESQRIVFDTITKLINIKRFFEKNNETNINFLSYKKEDFENCFNGIRSMFSRNNTIDNKIISFIENRLDF